MADLLRIALDLETTSDPIAGTLRVDGAQRPFTGWLGLIAALEAAITNRGDVASIATAGIDHEPTATP
jgi:hypothetical protein